MNARPSILTVTLNPAIDWMLDCPRLTPGTTHRIEQEVCCAGGKGINVATSLAGAGVSVAATGFLGRENDAIFRRHFCVHRIEDRCIRLAGKTRTVLKLVDRAAGQTTELNTAGLAPGVAELAALHAELAVFSHAEAWVVLAGSLPPGMPEDIYGQFVRMLRGKGVRVAVDTGGPALRAAIDARPDFVKPNLVEMEEWMGRELPETDAQVAAARQMCAQGVGTVVLSLGARGAIFAEGGAAFYVEAPAADVVSTVGAGDAMVAGMLSGLLAGEPLEARAGRAMALARQTVARIEPASCAAPTATACHGSGT